MFERCLNEAERILATHKQVIVPVKEVWEEVAGHARSQKFETATLGDFTALLEADGRFEIIAAERNAEEVQEELFERPESDEGQLRQLGFFSENRVKLRRIKLTKDEDGEDTTPSIVRGISVSSHTQQHPSRRAPKETAGKRKESAKGKKTGSRIRKPNRAKPKAAKPKRK